eukprot:CAMPEP_0174261806 /NCGR_PEP_ID=MMETSP0439-20130205/12257_1 /TAXON_ID=0 /ORGANISM="Stereomyxa ramosa, Strain Chinc5" /LENGTH=399 /DNA_ID=CAMNT_0015346377 /DNA_START=97 /DNA_END=1293 /DNA_ORIENTATION=+
MKSIFKPAGKNYAKYIIEQLDELETDDSVEAQKKAQRSISEYVKRLKQALYGDVTLTEDEKVDAAALDLNVQTIHTSRVLGRLIRLLTMFELETQKHIVDIFLFMLSWEAKEKGRVDSFSDHPEILNSLLMNFADLYMHTGVMLIQCIKYEALARAIMSEDAFWHLFEHASAQDFSVAAEALSILRALITEQPKVVSTFIQNNYDKFFEHWNGLLTGDHFAASQLTLELLGQNILPSSEYKPVTLRYTSEKENLISILKFLQSPQKNTQFNAFQVFKFIVANPKRTPECNHLLFANKDTLIGFLGNFLTERDEKEENFAREKAFLIKKLQELEEPTPLPEEVTENNPPSQQDLGEEVETESGATESDSSETEEVGEEGPPIPTEEGATDQSPKVKRKRW